MTYVSCHIIQANPYTGHTKNYSHSCTVLCLWGLVPVDFANNFQSHLSSTGIIRGYHAKRALSAMLYAWQVGPFWQDTIKLCDCPGAGEAPRRIWWKTSHNSIKFCNYYTTSKIKKKHSLIFMGYIASVRYTMTANYSHTLNLILSEIVKA